MAKKTYPWFRLYAEIIDDNKLRMLAFEDRWHYIAILSLKCSGLLDSGIEQQMMHRRAAVSMGLSTREVEEVARRLSEVGLIDKDTLQPTGWDERQFVSDSSTERVREYRERMKRRSNVSETAQETETEEETDNPPVVPPSGGHSYGGDQPTPIRKGAKCSLTAWLADKKAKGVQAIPEDHPIVAYSDNAGIPREFLRLAWWVFKAQFCDGGEQDGKRYIDWGMAFSNYVKKNYLRLWTIRAGQYELTPVGVQNLNVMTRSAAHG